MSFAPTAGGQRTTEDTPATQFSRLLEDLMMGTEYTITVVGFNSVSEGAPRDVTEATNIDREFTGVEN